MKTKDLPEVGQRTDERGDFKVTKSALVLGVAHQLQGPKFTDFVDHHWFHWLARKNITESDFVFEEASGKGPSIAEDLANEILSPGHYADIDPPADERARYGIPDGASGCVVIDPPHDYYEWVSIDAQKVREELWLRKITETSFKKAFVIVGFGHSLSLAFRLSSAGVLVEKALSFVPHHKLCAHDLHGLNAW